MTSPAAAQTPTEVAPPARSSVNQLAPPKITPSSLLPPKTPVNQLTPPAGIEVSQLNPPSAPLNAQRNAPTASPAWSGAGGATVQPQQLAPAIEAVRTQLEILQPPSPTPVFRSAAPPVDSSSRQASQNNMLTLEGPSQPPGQIAPATRVATLSPPARPATPSPSVATLPVPTTAPLQDPRSLLVVPPPTDDRRSMVAPRTSQSESLVVQAPTNPSTTSLRVQTLAAPPLVAQVPPPNFAPDTAPAITQPQRGQTQLSQLQTLEPPRQSSTTQSELPTPQPLQWQSPPSQVTQVQAPIAQAPIVRAPIAQVPQAQDPTNLVVPPTLEALPAPNTRLIVPQVSVLESPAGVSNFSEVVIQSPAGALSGDVINGASHEPTWQFNFQNAPWSLVIRSFAKQNGLALQMLTEPTGQFNFVDQRPYSATEALDLLNDYLLNEGFLLIRNGSKLTTVSAGAPVQEGIVPFVPMRQIDVLGRNELASVAIPIKSTDAPMVMSEIQPLLSRVGRAQVVSNSSRLVVTDTGAYLRRARDILGGYGLAASDLQTIVVHLKNTTAENMAATISAHLGNSIGASSVATAAGQTGAGGVIQAAAVSVSPAGLSSMRVVADRETNSLLLSGTPAEVAEVQGLICQLDQARAQVVLQGLILEVNLGNVNELGAEVGLQDSVLFNRSVIDNLVTLSQTNTSANGVQTTNQSVVSQTAAPGFAFNNQALGNNVAVSPNVLGTQGLGNLGVGRTNSQLGFGGLVLSASSNSVSLLLRALQANFQVDVLSRPQIRTVDNKEAFIQIGQQVPVVDGVNVTAVGTANPIIRQDQAGIILRMTPNVSPDGLIQIKVNAEKSAFKLQPGTGVPIFTDARNGTVIQAPIKDITTAQATVSARAGQTIVLGGMITRDEETIQRRVPGLWRIPLLGRLFRYDYNNTVRKELLIFLTPQIIADDATSDAYKDSEINRIHAPLERAAEIHGNLLSGSAEPEPIIEQVIRPE